MNTPILIAQSICLFMALVFSAQYVLKILKFLKDEGTLTTSDHSIACMLWALFYMFTKF